MAMIREKFTIQVDSEILSSVRSIARTEGRQVQALVEEAFVDLIEKRKKATTRAHVMDAYFASHDQYAALYKKLAG